jgi:short-chain fatty acids transporter
MFMLRAISQRFNMAVENYLPNAFIFAIFLTVITLLLGLTIGDQSFFSMMDHWYNGFWNFLAFTTQMVMILVTGYALVEAPIIKKWLTRLASKPKNQRSALTYTILVAAIGGYLSWGIGFVLGTLFAIQVARNVKTADFRILIAAAFTGTISVLPASLTITAPLLVNTPGHSLEDKIGLISPVETIFSPMLLGVAGVSLFVILWAYHKMMPDPDHVIPFEGGEEAASLEVTTIGPENRTIATILDNSKLLNYSIISLGFFVIVMYFYKNGFNLDLNILNFLFLMIGMALHGSPNSYIRAIISGMPSAGGIMLQFPFYAGIMGMMIGSGLIGIIAQWFVSVSNEYTFPFFSLLSASIVNIFVPSAGGQWQIQGPIMIEAVERLNMNYAIAVNTVTIGDIVTNLLQPFFVLPALGLTGLSLKDIWGYCLVSMFLIFIVATIGVTLIPIWLG